MLFNLQSTMVRMFGSSPHSHVEILIPKDDGIIRRWGLWQVIGS